MTTALYMQDDCLAHVTPPGHPERVERLEAVAAALSQDRFNGLQRREAPLAERDELLRCHPASYVARIEAAIPEQGNRSLDADTHVSPGSWAAALRAVGAAGAAVDAVMAGDVANAFCATRPPGHHAETAKAMGFCLFGTAAIAAKRALDHHGLNRIAVVDFDVHHGNGTQDLLWNEARTFFVGSHQMPLWPGTGDKDETGAHGNVMNLPLPPGTGSAGFRRVWEAHGLPTLDAFAPELIIISAGFDAHQDDPLAQLNLREADFAWITEALCDLADTHAGGRVVSTLEGGYDLSALAASTAVHIDVLIRRGHYGRPRMTEELKEIGLDVGHRRVGRLMRQNGISVVRTRKHKVTTDSDHKFNIAPNLLDRDFTANAPNQKWAGDISYVWTREGWLYLAVILDLHSRRVIGWAVSNRMKRDLAIRALKMAIAFRQPPKGCIHHTDRGSQYCSHDYQKILRKHGFKVSMSGRGNCYDNAAVETFFKTIKAELIWRHPWETRRKAEMAIFEYINGFYNPRRRHSALGWKSPVAFERKVA